MASKSTRLGASPKQPARMDIWCSGSTGASGVLSLGSNPSMFAIFSKGGSRERDVYCPLTQQTLRRLYGTET